jgi:hypothetical protein
MTIDNALVEGAEWLFDRLINAESEIDRAYYQGRIDSLADARRIVARQLEGRVSAWKGCAQCGDTSDLLARFTASGVCGKCARANHRKALGKGKK